jgi:DnaK suppressor protein
MKANTKTKAKAKKPAKQAMPDGLVERRQQLESELGRLKEGLNHGRHTGPEDEADRACEDAEFDLQASVTQEIERELQQIDEAMKKVTAGTYGLCEICGEMIGKNRLKALPSASLCLKCKEEEEREIRSGGARPTGPLYARGVPGEETPRVRGAFAVDEETPKDTADASESSGSED